MFAIGCAVLIGWFRDIEVLRGLSPRFVSMKPSAAVAFMCLGVALLFASMRRRAVTDALSWLLQLSVLALGVATLVEYASNVDLGIERWLVPAVRNDLQTSLLDATSVLAGLCFVLLPIALSAERSRSAGGRAIARAVATCVGIVGLLALLGYVYGAPVLYQPIPQSAAIPVHAALAFMLLAAGVVALQPQYGLPNIAAGPTLVGTHVRWLFPAALVIPPLVGVLAVQTYQSFGGARSSIAIAAVGTTIAISLTIGVAALCLRRIEDKLAISNRALAATKQGVFIADGDEQGLPIIYVNEAFTRLTGYSEKNSLGRRCDFFVAGKPDDTALQQLEDALRTRTNVTVTLPCRRRDGTVLSARLSVSIVPGSDNREHLVGLLEDVTAEQLAAMARLELLAEASQARKDAESANRVKDVFFASITHELRSPLNACAMWLDVLALGPLSDKSAKAVDALKRNLKIQTRLVNDLIDAAKISSGGIEVHREPHELGQLIESGIETWQLMATAHGVQLACRLAPEVHVLDVDPERLMQVLNNLLENAFSNTPSGGRVELHVETTSDGVAIEVEDTGSGLSAEDLQHIFTPFWRARSTKQSHRGLGLGLAIAENLVKGHQGTLSARSDGPGKGCTFRIHLPRSSAGLPLPGPLFTLQHGGRT